MITKDKIKNLSVFGKEVILQVLKKAEDLRSIFEKNKDEKSKEKIEENVIKVYEKFLTFVELENLEKNIISDEDYEKIANFIDRLLLENKFTKEYINKEIEKRQKNIGKSGSEAVKKFFEMKLKKLISEKENTMKNIEILLVKEEKLNLELSNSIQEKEQLKIINKMTPVRRKYFKLLEEIKKIDEKIKKNQEKIDKKWPYEIYGAIEEKMFLKGMMKNGNKSNHKN